MKASLIYRIAAVALVLFAISHTIGFNQTDPAWGIDPIIRSMRSVHFDLMGSSHSFWDLFLALGYQVGVLYVFAAVLAWQLGGLPVEARAQMRLTRWSFAACFAGVAILCCHYLFIIPIVFSILVTLLLALGAWLSK